MRKYINTVISHPLFSGSMIMIIGSNAVSFLNYLYHLTMGRMLGPANYGELAALISLIGLLGIVPGSLSMAIIKHVSSTDKEDEIAVLIQWLKGKALLISVIFFILVLITSPLITSFLNISNTSYLILVAVSFLFSIQSGLNRSILQGLLKFKDMVNSMLAENCIKLAASILLVYLGFQVSGAMMALVLTTLLGWYITNLYLKNHPVSNIKISSSLIKSMLFFTIPVAVQSVATTSLYSSDVILVKHFFPSHDAGIYASLSTLGKIIFFGAGPVGAVMFPLVSKRNARGEGYKKIFQYSFISTALLAAGILLIYWLYPQVAIKILFGTAYLEAASLLVWFGIFISLFTLSSLLISYGLSLGITSIVVFPLIAAIMQIILIWFFHQTLFMVIIISTIVLALLLVSLLIYSTYAKRILI